MHQNISKLSTFAISDKKKSAGAFPVGYPLTPRDIQSIHCPAARIVNASSLLAPGIASQLDLQNLAKKATGKPHQFPSILIMWVILCYNCYKLNMLNPSKVNVVNVVSSGQAARIAKRCGRYKPPHCPQTWRLLPCPCDPKSRRTPGWAPTRKSPRGRCSDVEHHHWSFLAISKSC